MILKSSMPKILLTIAFCCIWYNIYSTAVQFTLMKIHSTAIQLTELNIYSTAVLLTVQNTKITAVQLTILNIYSTAVLLTVYSSKALFIAFSGETNILYNNNKLWENSGTRACTVRDCMVQLVLKLRFHTRIHCIFIQSVRLLGLIQTITDVVSTLNSSLTMCSTPVTPRLQYTSIVWNSITCTDG